MSRDYSEFAIKTVIRTATSFSVITSWPTTHPAELCCKLKDLVYLSKISEQLPHRHPESLTFVVYVFGDDRLSYNGIHEISLATPEKCNMNIDTCDGLVNNIINCLSFSRHFTYASSSSSLSPINSVECESCDMNSKLLCLV